MSFTPVQVQRVNAYQAVVEQIEGAIERGELRPGDRLPGERQLMGDFAVSRATIREALRVLQANGLVESRPGDPRGPVITRYPARLLEKSLSRLAQVDSIGRVEILQFRLILAGHAAQLAAQVRDEADLAAIEAQVERIETNSAEQSARFAEIVNDYHAAIHRASGNQFIESCGRAIGGITNSVMASRLASDSDARARVDRSAKDARRLLDAIRSGDAALAFRTAVGNIYRYYEDDLSDAERERLAPILTTA